MAKVETWSRRNHQPARTGNPFIGKTTLSLRCDAPTRFAILPNGRFHTWKPPKRRPICATAFAVAQTKSRNAGLPEWQFSVTPTDEVGLNTPKRVSHLFSKEQQDFFTTRRSRHSALSSSASAKRTDNAHNQTLQRPARGGNRTPKTAPRRRTARSKLEHLAA